MKTKHFSKKRVVIFGFYESTCIENVIRLKLTVFTKQKRAMLSTYFHTFNIIILDIRYAFE